MFKKICSYIFEIQKSNPLCKGIDKNYLQNMDVIRKTNNMQNGKSDWV